VKFNSRVVDFFVLFVILAFLFSIFFYFQNFFYRDSFYSYGKYVCKTSLPSFLGNSIRVDLNYGGRDLEIFLGRSESVLHLYKEYLHFKSFIYTRYVSNFDIFFTNFYVFQLLRKDSLLGLDKVILIEFFSENSDAFLTIGGVRKKMLSYYTYGPYLLNNTKILKFSLILRSLEGEESFAKNIYIKNVFLKLTLKKDD